MCGSGRALLSPLPFGTFEIYVVPYLSTLPPTKKKKVDEMGVGVVSPF